MHSIDWSFYEFLTLRGGEIFNDYPEEIVPIWVRFLEDISDLVKEEKIKKIFLISSLKYPWETSLLKFTLDKLDGLGVNIKKQTMVGTSWDVKYRFPGQSLEWWNDNVNHLKELGVGYHVTTILTQAFIDAFYAKNQTVLDLMTGEFDFIAAQGKPELLHLKEFFPRRADCLRFLMDLKSAPYRPIWERLLHQEARRAETICFTELGNIQTRDLANFTTVFNEDQQGTMACGHPKEFDNYLDSDACFLCDLKKLELLD